MQVSVQIFTSDGTHFKTLGGVRGEGPGEFMGYLDLGISDHDWLYVYDKRLRRISVFDGDYHLKQTIRVPEAFKRYAKEMWLDPAGGFYMLYSPGHRSDNLGEQLFDIVARINRDGEVETGFQITVKSKESLILTMSSGGYIASSMPFAHRPVFKTLPDGTLLGGYSETFRIDKYSPAGKATPFIEHTSEPAEVDEADREDFIESFAELPEKLVEQARGKLPEKWPVFDDFAVDEKGQIWVTVNPRTDEGGSVILLNSEGNLIGQIRLEPGVVLNIVKNGYAYGVKTGEDGLETVVKYLVEERTR